MKVCIAGMMNSSEELESTFNGLAYNENLLSKLWQKLVPDLTFSQYPLNCSNSSERVCRPLVMTLMKSWVNTNGWRSLLIPNFSLKWPRMCPKSIWKSCPFFITIMLSEWRSAMPKTYVATQYPAQDRVNSWIALFSNTSVGLWSFNQARKIQIIDDVYD